MQNYFGFIMTLLLLGAIAWFVTYQVNPAAICEVNPNKEKAKEGYLWCWPGFNFPTDTFIDGYSPIPQKRKIYQYRK